MTPSFYELLAAVRGTIHRVNVYDDFARRRDGLLYYWNCAAPLHDSAKIIWGSHGSPDVAAMLIGMAVELLLKGIHVAFTKAVPAHHRLGDLSRAVGITPGSNDKIILDSLSEHVIWASRYPAPKDASKLFFATQLFDKQRRKGGSLARYHIEEVSLSAENCEILWTLYANYYHKAREARLESAEPRY